MALWFLEQSGVVLRENGTLKLGKTEASDGDESGTENQMGGTASTESHSRDAPILSHKNRAGAIRLNVEIDVDTEEIAKWTPDRITSFMSGLAQVLAAKGEASKNLP